jgi:hypothetical protein
LQMDDLDILAQLGILFLKIEYHNNMELKKLFSFLFDYII